MDEPATCRPLMAVKGCPLTVSRLEGRQAPPLYGVRPRFLVVVYSRVAHPSWPKVRGWLVTGDCAGPVVLIDLKQE